MTITTVAGPDGCARSGPPAGPSTMEACRTAQLAAAARDPRILSLGDLDVPAWPGDPGRTGGPVRPVPGRFPDAGLAGAGAVGAAAGLARRGAVPFVNAPGTSALLRAYHQVRLELARHHANVKIVGVPGASSGPAHPCGEDVAAARALPGMVVLSPADAEAAWHLTAVAADWQGPVYLRLNPDPAPRVYAGPAAFTVGGSNVLRDGDDVTIVAAGAPTVAAALGAAGELAVAGLNARVVDLYSIKPLDRRVLVDSARLTGLVVTVEEHSTIGGLGAAVAETLASELPVPMRMLGLPDEFTPRAAPCGGRAHQYGLDSGGIAAAVAEHVRRWRP